VLLPFIVPSIFTTDHHQQKLRQESHKAGNVFLLPEYPYKVCMHYSWSLKTTILVLADEVDQLFGVFKKDLNVTTSKKFTIPSKTPFAVLEKVLCDWKKKYSCPETC